MSNFFTRLEQEIASLSERIEKLEAVFENIDTMYEIGPEQLQLMVGQLAAMKQYRKILSKRIKLARP